MSLSVMVASEPSELLLLYITAKAEVVSMVHVIERPEPKQPQALKGAPTAGSGSQILEPTLSPEPQSGSRFPEVTSSPEDQEDSGSQVSKPTTGPNSQHTARSQPPEVPSDPGDQAPQAPESMDIDSSDPLGRVQTIQ
jgi:hypothetical protein